LDGTKSNRAGIGATVTVRSGKDNQTQMLRSGSSYLSSNELVLTFGLGQHLQVDEIKIAWPSGQSDRIANIPAGQTITIKEGGSIVQRRPYNSKKPVSTVAQTKAG